jgi:hypothetical protein
VNLYDAIEFFDTATKLNDFSEAWDCVRAELYRRQYLESLEYKERIRSSIDLVKSRMDGLYFGEASHLLDKLLLFLFGEPSQTISYSVKQRRIRKLIKQVEHDIDNKWPGAAKSHLGELWELISR